MNKESIEQIKNKKAIIFDMDGVLYHGNNILPGVKDLIAWLQKENKKFLFLTNSSERTPRELSSKLHRMGIDVDESHFYTSALATAAFLHSQLPSGSAYVIGEPGLLNALYNVGYAINNVDPDYVVVGDTHAYNYEKIEEAIRLVIKGAKLIGTNPDLTGPTEGGISPSTKALIAPVELASGKKAYFVGKPNPLMMRMALKKLTSQREDTIIIGDRMDTDIIAGIESEIDTVLVLSGITTKDMIKNFSYRPRYVLDGVKDLLG